MGASIERIDNENYMDVVAAAASKTTVTVSRAIISGATSGDNTIVAAATGLKTKVLGLFLIATGEVTV